SGYQHPCWIHLGLCGEAKSFTWIPRNMAWSATLLPKPYTTGHNWAYSCVCWISQSQEVTGQVPTKWGDNPHFPICADFTVWVKNVNFSECHQLLISIQKPKNSSKG